MEREAAEAAKQRRLVRQLSSNTYQSYIMLQRAKRRLLSTWRRLHNCTVGLVLPSRAYDAKAVDGDDVLVPIDAAKLVDDLLAVHGYEVLIDGCFNADPHPGNVLYVDGKLALIDYGQVKRYSRWASNPSQAALTSDSARFEPHRG